MCWLCFSRLHLQKELKSYFRYIIYIFLWKSNTKEKGPRTFASQVKLGFGDLGATGWLECYWKLKATIVDPCVPTSSARRDVFNSRRHLLSAVCGDFRSASALAYLKEVQNFEWAVSNYQLHYPYRIKNFWYSLALRQVTLKATVHRVARR